MRRTNLLASIASLAAAGFFMLASAAHADTITHYTFGNTGQSVTLTNNGSGEFTAQLGSLSNGAYTLSSATIGNSVNTESGEANELSNFTISTANTIGFKANNGQGVFYADSGSTSTLQITDVSDADNDAWPAATVTWSYMKDGTNMPTLVGTASINGINYIIDLQLSTIGSLTLGAFAASTTLMTVGNVISSGQLDLSPEPVSLLLMMLGFAIVGVAVLKRRNTASDDQHLPLAA